MLSSYLETKCKVYHAPADVDVLIVQKTLESAAIKDTALIGDDTDLLILLCYHASMEDCHSVFFLPT